MKNNLHVNSGLNLTNFKEDFPYFIIRIDNYMLKLFKGDKYGLFTFLAGYNWAKPSAISFAVISNIFSQMIVHLLNYLI